MHDGHPCKELNFYDEYFQDGITNGAAWYNVHGKLLLVGDKTFDD